MKLSSQAVLCVTLLIQLDAAVSAGIYNNESWRTNATDSMRIFNGAPVGLGELKYVAYIRDSTRFKACTGGILHPSWVLTAAHCVGKYKISDDITIVAGIIGFDGDQSDKRQVRRALRIIRHPKYIVETTTYDACLLKTDWGFDFNAYVASVPLTSEPWSRTEMYTRQCVAAGFGMYSDTEGSRIMRKAYVTARHGGRGCACHTAQQNEHLICLQKTGRGCPGDSGSMLVCSGKAVGIASAIFRCGYPDPNDVECSNSITIYFYICKIHSWIKQYVPDVPREPPRCRTNPRRSHGGYYGSVGDNWDSASIKSSDSYLIAALIFFLTKQ